MPGEALNIHADPVVRLKPPAPTGSQPVETGQPARPPDQRRSSPWPSHPPASSTPSSPSASAAGSSSRRGEIYGGTRSAWDYGPLGVELKENIKRQWWQFDGHRPRRRRRPRLVGHPAAPGLGGLRPRRDVHRPAGRVPALPQALPRRPPAGGVRGEEGLAARQRPRPTSPARTAAPAASGPSRATSTCMLKTYLGPVEDESGLHYLRPETAQGIFVNFANVADQRAARSRRSASPRSASASATRSRPATSSSAPASSSRWRWSSSSSPAPTRSGTSTGSTQRTRLVRRPRHRPATTCATSSTRRRSSRHYSKRTVDIEYRFGFAGQRVGRARGHRQPHRLRPHDALRSTPAQDLSLLRPGHRASATSRTSSSRRPASTRSLMAFLVDAYTEDEAPNTKGGVDKRTVLRLDPRLAPVKVAVLPLSPQRGPVARRPGPRRRAAQALERRVRRRRRDRPPLPPPGRDRHAVLRHRRLRHPRGPGRHRPRARHDEPGARLARPGAAPTSPQRLLGC